MPSNHRLGAYRQDASTLNAAVSTTLFAYQYAVHIRFQITTANTVERTKSGSTIKMASVFTFEPEPPRVSSPWTELLGPAAGGSAVSQASPGAALSFQGLQGSGSIPGKTAKLVEEPQLGPVEYKLHLLLRPRRRYLTSSTGSRITGSQHSRALNAALSAVEASPIRQSDNSPVSHAPSPQSRQHRLHQLTTQLLWRLQQSGPHCASSRTPLNLPEMPTLAELDVRLRSDGTVPGLEESHGALYEIGVSDDGSFIGLTKDELDESLETLRAMARSLGCTVHVLRHAVVGSCEWLQSSEEDLDQAQNVQKEELLVAEALVKPLLDKNGPGTTAEEMSNQAHVESNGLEDNSGLPRCLQPSTHEPQLLRVSLTGATTCGKSSMLGTLSTATLDNGRGRSRLSLLKHRHELASGLTSSVTQELIGYRPLNTGDEDQAEVVNYASGNVSTWTDIHASAANGRLVFVSDSAGHPRYRRTTIRGLVGWAPHWALLCVAANGADGDDPQIASPDAPLPPGTAMELSEAHLGICLKLGLPLVVVLTKLDVASKAGLRRVLSQVLSVIKGAGRKPVIVTPRAGSEFSEGGPDIRHVSEQDEADVDPIIKLIHNQGPRVVVPVVLTSAVNGTGIGVIHALLRSLPIPLPLAPPLQASLVSGGMLRPLASFSIDEVFPIPAQLTMDIMEELSRKRQVSGCVVSGHLDHGEISIGDELVLGPFPVENSPDEELRSSDDQAQPPPQHVHTFVEGPRDTSNPQGPLVNGSNNSQLMYHHASSEWRKVRVVSIRNLRLPTSRLLEDQVGTIGLVTTPSEFPSVQTPMDPSLASNAMLEQQATTLRIRKGMMLARPGVGYPRSCSGMVAIFYGPQPGFMNGASAVVVYIGSIRAPAKLVEMERIKDITEENRLDRPAQSNADQHQATHQVTLRFLTSRECVQVGSQVLVMPSSVPNSSGDGTTAKNESVRLLEGSVGRVMQILG